MKALALLLRLGAKSVEGRFPVFLLSGRAATINFHSRSSLHHHHLRLSAVRTCTAVSRAPGSRDFQPYGTWTLKPHSSVQSTTSCSSHVGRHSRAHRAPLISLPYYRDHLPVATCSVAHAASSAPASALPLPSSPPRALCVAKTNTFLTDHRICQTVTDIRFAD